MPVRGVLVQLSKLPVHWVNVHVVVLLKVLSQQLHRVIPSMQTSLTLENFLHLEEHNNASFNYMHFSFPNDAVCLSD